MLRWTPQLLSWAGGSGGGSGAQQADALAPLVCTQSSPSSTSTQYLVSFSSRTSAVQLQAAHCMCYQASAAAATPVTRTLRTLHSTNGITCRKSWRKG